MRSPTLVALFVALLPVAALAQSPDDDTIIDAIDHENAVVRAHIGYVVKLPLSLEDAQGKAAMACLRSLNQAAQAMVEKRDQTDMPLAVELEETRIRHRNFDACLARAKVTVPSEAVGAK